MKKFSLSIIIFFSVAVLAYAFWSFSYGSESLPVINHEISYSEEEGCLIARFVVISDDGKDSEHKAYFQVFWTDHSGEEQVCEEQSFSWKKEKLPFVIKKKVKSCIPSPALEKERYGFDVLSTVRLSVRFD
jgi:hypothetical protein